MAQTPVAVGLMLCEKVIVEEGTRNFSLINCFTQRTVKRLPSEPVLFVVFTTLTNGLGEMQLTLRIERLDTLEAVYEWSKPLRLGNPLHSVRCTWRVSDCSFPVVGSYDVLLLGSVR